MHLPLELLICIAEWLDDVRDIYTFRTLHPRFKTALGPKLCSMDESILLACELGDVELFHEILSARDDIRQRFSQSADTWRDMAWEQHTPLASAAKHRQLAMIPVIAEAGLLAGQGRESYFSFGPRGWADRTSDWAVFDALMSVKAIRTNFISGTAASIIINVVETGENDALQRLLDLEGIEEPFRATLEWRRLPPLVAAAKYKNMTALKMLMQKDFLISTLVSREKPLRWAWQ